MPEKKVLIVLVLLCAMVSACNFPLEFGYPEEDVGDAVAETVEALEKAEAEAEEPEPVLELAPTYTPMPTNTPEPTYTAEATLTDEPTATVEATEDAEATSTPCYSAYFVSESKPYDGTKMSPGESFTKSWTLRNVGWCNWKSNFVLDFDDESGGHQMGGPDVQTIGKKVKPNGEVKITLNLKAPNKAGTHYSKWNLQTNEGEDISDFPVYVMIVVE